ncbi:MAG TPA: hypothetical protein VFQ80_12645 [Thermomicrobiales bacterium]|nr:hypothetical protein [Thermomicrobiales bacterium]
MTEWPGWPTFNPARAQKAVRVRALTDPRGALGVRQTGARVERERQARRAVFLATLASFVGTFAAIALRAAPPAPTAPADAASSDRLVLARAAEATTANTTAAAAPIAQSPSVQVAPPTHPARRMHARTHAS